MVERIVETANKYKVLANALKESAGEGNIIDDGPDYIRKALLTLYRVKALDIEMEKCQAFLSEDSDEETVEAVMSAAAAVEDASNKAFEAIEKYSADNVEFEKKIEDLTLGAEADSLDDRLCKLYKCEGIIRQAYKCTAKYPTYGIPDSIMDSTNDMEAITDPEDFIKDDMNIDIYALLDIREKLVGDIASLLGEEK